MFSYLHLNRRYPNNAALSKYALESTNNSIRKLTQEYNEERKAKMGILVKQHFFKEKEEKEETRLCELKQKIVIYSGILSIACAMLNFLFNHK